MLTIPVTGKIWEFLEDNHFFSLENHLILHNAWWAPLGGEGVHPSVHSPEKEEKLPFVLWIRRRLTGRGTLTSSQRSVLQSGCPLRGGAVQVGAPCTAAPNFACVAVVWGQTIALFADLAPYMDIFSTKALCSDLSRHSGCVCPNHVTAG